MPVNLSGQSYLRLLDFSTEQIEYLLKLSKNFKDLKRTGTPHRYLEGKNIVLLFQKTSTRTRCAFEVGAMDLGMGVTYLDPGSSQMGKKESIEDTARVLGRFYDGIEFRGFAQSDVEELADKAGVPVWNGLTDMWHPTQMLADALTVQENFNYDIKGLKFVFFGDLKNNMGRSLMVMCAKLGMNFVGCGPKDCWMDEELIKTCERYRRRERLHREVHRGREGSRHRRRRHLHRRVGVHGRARRGVGSSASSSSQPYRVTTEIMAMAKPTAIFLHCLPAFHDTNTTTGEDIAKRFGVTEMEVEDDGVRVQAVQGLRRGREPHAHHQGRHVRHPAVACVIATVAGT